MNIIIITGPPYSGKGTQCDELVKDHDLVHISTGDHIRNEKENQTELGKIMSDYDEKGELVPDEIMKKLLDKLIEENKHASGIILDGYPRTIPQVEDLVKVLSERELSINSIISIEVPRDELLIRAKKRAETSTREDDKNPETHYKRIRVFEELTKPTIEYMKKKFQVKTFDGMGAIEEITERIKASM
ncbi:adenylate kinase [Flavivirga eckloniae]|uniref:Adenylate kinase n=2 Tax=Flavivirga eckloniae TaxID=1803846 RepID=A0A2K9PX16_9FLAO|nr:adenylate kinase [Flavivirga eckloniae]